MIVDKNLLKFLLMAVVMVAAPQIVSAILHATSARALRDSAVFIAGATLATTIGVTTAYLLTAYTNDAWSDVIDCVIIVLLLSLIIVVFRKLRKTRPRN